MTEACPPDAISSFGEILVQVSRHREQCPAVGLAVKLARRFDAEVTLFDVSADLSWPLQYVAGGWEELIERIGGAKRRSLHELADSLTNDGIPAAAEVADGRLAPEIVRRVTEANHDLVIKVAEGKSSNRSGFLGSTDRWLLRDCPCPVLILNPDRPMSFARVAVALDVMDGHAIQSTLDQRVLAAARLFSEGNIELLYAMPQISEILQVDQTDTDLIDVEQLARWDRELRAAATQKLETMAADGTQESVHVVPGDPEVAIPEFVNSHDIGLLAMGTLARSGLEGMLIGNTAERILADVSCSVLALKPAEFSSPSAKTDNGATGQAN